MAEGYKGAKFGTKIAILLIILLAPLFVLLGIFATHCC